MRCAPYTTANSSIINTKKPTVKYRGQLPEVEERIFSFTSKFNLSLIRKAFVIAERRYAFVVSGNESQN